MLWLIKLESARRGAGSAARTLKRSTGLNAQLLLRFQHHLGHRQHAVGIE